MTIGFIGAGEVALAIARYALSRGQEVCLSGRSGPDALAVKVAELGEGAAAASVAEAAGHEIVVLAVPWKHVTAALEGLPNWQGRILIDATNPFLETGAKPVMADLGDVGASEIVAGQAPGARLVKAFNSITMKKFVEGPVAGGGKRVLFVSGDDAAAKKQVAELIQSFGFATIDLGGLSEGKIQQAGGPLAGQDLAFAS